MSNAKAKQPKSLLEASRTSSPFIWVSFAWAALSLTLCAGKGLGWVVALWALAMLDLTALANAVSSAMAVMDLDLDPSKKPALYVRTLFWGTTKVLCLGLIAGALYFAREAPSRAVLLGMSTLLIVPLLGGFWWSQRELSHA